MSALTSAKARAGRPRRLSLLAAAVLVAAAPSVARAQDIPIVRDAEIEEILKKDGYPIWEAAGLDAKNMRVMLVGDKDINAFTAGGLVIYVNTGLIEAAKNPNQLIGVIAHETGHISGGHVARDMGGKPALATYLLTMGLGILAAAAGAPDAAAGLLYSADYFATLTYFGYSRTQEASADQAAATFLDKAHISGRGLVDFFENFRYEEVFADARKNRFFYDHPLSSERIDALNSRVQKSAYYNEVDTPEALAEHAVMVAKLKAFMNAPQQTFIDYKETDTSFPARYARAIAYYRNLDTDKALKLTDALLADYPNDPYMWELKGQILFEAGRPKEAEPAHERSVALKPDSALLQFNLGQTLVAEEDPRKVGEAIAHLQKGLDLEHDNSLGWWLLAQAYDAKGDAGRARLATAEQNFWLGQMKDARAFALQARNLLPRDTADWRRATDIVLTSQPSEGELQSMARQGG
ncbi:MAG TPA: M48 family metalloprotease [Caulobacteraceae bacterium]|nr:M48 family metalloprotease [Caulobacteraceae bacterium]